MGKELELARELVKLLEKRRRKAELSTLKCGDFFKIGDYDFVVLEQNKDQTIVISKEIMAKGVVFGEKTRNYSVSNLRKLIEEKIQPIIEKEVGTENLVENVLNLNSVDMQNEFGFCLCKVRPITFDEARKYNNLLVNKELDDWYWTCTPWSTAERDTESSVIAVSTSGCFHNYYCRSYGGVRPVCILKSNTLVSKGE